MVTGGEDPNDCCLFSVPDFKPLKNYIVGELIRKKVVDLRFWSASPLPEDIIVLRSL